MGHFLKEFLEKSNAEKHGPSQEYLFMTNKKNPLIERGKRLQSLRKKAGLTRLAFAEQTGMSANTLKALELGDRELTAQKALLFSNLFSSLFSVSLGEDAHEASFEYLY